MHACMLNLYKYTVCIDYLTLKTIFKYKLICYNYMFEDIIFKIYTIVCHYRVIISQLVMTGGNVSQTHLSSYMLIHPWIHVLYRPQRSVPPLDFIRCTQQEAHLPKCPFGAIDLFHVCIFMLYTVCIMYTLYFNLLLHALIIIRQL